jgi:DNA-binding NarL/FixJ family response regulator
MQGAQAATMPRASSAGRKRVLLIDDHELVRDGLRLIIDGTKDLCVCGDVSDVAGGQQAVAELQPDVAIVDLSLHAGGIDGLSLVKWIYTHHPKTKCVVSSMHEERLYGERALRAGAAGYVSKSAPARSVLEAIRRACAGQLHFSQELVDAMLRRSAHSGRVERSPIENFSDRELQVFRGIGQGLSSKEIASSLHVSVSTIDTYRERLKVKLGVAGGAELVHRATRWNLENP